MYNTDRIKYVGYKMYADDDVNDRIGYCNSILARDEYELHQEILSTNITDVLVYDVINKKELTNKEIFELMHKDRFTREESKYSNKYYYI